MSTTPIDKRDGNSKVRRSPRWRLLKRLLLVVGGLGVLFVGTMGAHGYYRARAPLRDVLPTFVEMGVGRRAPASEAFGMHLGQSTLAEVKTLLSKAGLDCQDTSMRALMQQTREAKRAEIAAAKARGDSLDAISGASMVNHRSPKEANPQVRLSCENVSPSVLATFGKAQPPRAAGVGRLLMVFDSAAHPLRHVSFERTLPATANRLAAAEITQVGQYYRERLGAAAKTASKPGDKGEVKDLPWLSPVETEWLFADLRASVKAINYGARGIVISESMEVPWPIRADAPCQHHRRPDSQDIAGFELAHQP